MLANAKSWYRPKTIIDTQAPEQRHYGAKLGF
jgi:hypothetical protein